MKLLKFLNGLICIVLLLEGLESHGQNERNTWYFGQKAGMKYESGRFTPLEDNTLTRSIAFGMVNGPDNLICANDSIGNIMFYSDGRIFKNRLHENMLNSPTDYHIQRDTQMAIVRDPSNKDRFYVFKSIADGFRAHLSYTLVDMSLDGGLGGLVEDQKNVRLARNVNTQLAVARHANGRDSWLICIKNGIYLSYLITENGISAPVPSNAGLSFTDGTAGQFGAMEISPNNQLLAATFPLMRKLFILKFHDLTGKLKRVYEEFDDTEYEPAEDGSVPGPFTCVEFSGNSQVLYTGYARQGIYQYDLSDLDTIPARQLVVEGLSPNYLKRGPKDIIFVNERGNFHLGAIKQPNELGPACEFEEVFISLGLGRETLVDLPSFLMPKHPPGISYQNICEGEPTEFNYQTPFGSPDVVWDFGDGTVGFGSNPTHLYEQPGTYEVTIEAYNFLGEVAYTDSINLTVYDSPEILDIPDSYHCTRNSSLFLNSFTEDILEGNQEEVFNVEYYLSESDAFLQAEDEIELDLEQGSQRIYARIENKENPSCYTVKSFEVITPEFVELDMPEEFYLCNAKDRISIDAPQGFLSYEWSNGESGPNIEVNSPGIYELTVEKDLGSFICNIKTSIRVVVGDPPPVISEIEVTDWSFRHNSIKVHLEESGYYQYSVDGINFQDSPVFEDLPIRDYKVFVRDANCLKSTESDTLFLLYYDRFFTPNGDGINDYWRVINSKQEENIEIYIYDRYGKMLATLDFDDRGWDGKVNGVLLPNSDYWFRVIRENGEVHNGHFSLKR
jgi:gliding motility-associated-like protein